MIKFAISSLDINDKTVIKKFVEHIRSILDQLL